jgi:hypothetical protein
VSGEGLAGGFNRVVTALLARPDDPRTPLAGSAVKPRQKISQRPDHPGLICGGGGAKVERVKNDVFVEVVPCETLLISAIQRPGSVTVLNAKPDALPNQGRYRRTWVKQG